MATDDRMGTNSGLQRLSEMSGYSVGADDPDVRGWNVVGSGGEKIGTVDDLLVDTARMKVAALAVDVKGSGDRMQVPVERVDVDRSRREVRVEGYAPGYADTTTTGYGERSTGYADTGAASRTGAHTERGYAAGERSERDRQVVTRSEEELQVGKRETEAGEFVVGKHVETERVQKPVSLRREEAYVERRPVSGERSGEIEMRDDEIRVPLTREEAVVEKRPVVKEELVIGKKTVEEQETVEADVRREEFDVNDRGTPSRKRRS
jgi:uncharacterized protein (TIGR02271 family)